MKCLSVSPLARDTRPDEPENLFRIFASTTVSRTRAPEFAKPQIVSSAKVVSASHRASGKLTAFVTIVVRTGFSA